MDAVQNMENAPIRVNKSKREALYNNTVRNNAHGIRFSVCSRNNVVASNTFEDNTGYDVYQYRVMIPWSR